MPDLDATMPSSLRARARWETIADGTIPVLLVHPTWEPGHRVPVMIWMHGRTASKELDPGRYLRWMRAGIGACAVDLPGHGERFEAAMQEAPNTLDVILRAVREVDVIAEAVRGHGAFDAGRLGLGGMSAGGLTTIARLCDPHDFLGASVEAATGSWANQRDREMFRNRSEAEIARLDPMQRLDGWREIPFQAIHARHDEWVAWAGQNAFVEALRTRYADPGRVRFVTYEQTGAPAEHAGFGRLAADAKQRQTDFLREALGGTATD